jgi:flagellar biosynthesis/type III secretory pathway protein FliH
VSSALRAQEKNLSPERIKIPRAPLAAQLGEGRLQDALERLLEQRESAGFAAGREAARSEALLRLDEATARLCAANEAVNATLASDSVELALCIAAELVRTNVAAQRHDMEAIVRDALSASGVGRGACTVHVSPADAARLADVPFRAGTRIEADPDVRAACVQVEAPQGLLVRDIEAALASITARLREEART